MEWFKKKKLDPLPVKSLEETSAEDLLKAKLAQLNPNAKYLFIWEQTLREEHINVIRESLDKLLGPSTCSVIAGIAVPEIYELVKELPVNVDQQLIANAGENVNTIRTRKNELKKIKRDKL